MSNQLLTIDMITRYAVALWKNTNQFIQNIDSQYSPEFAVPGAKIGDTIRIRLPNQFTVANGPAASVQDTDEKYTSLTLGYQRHVDTAFTSVQMTLQLDDFLERILLPKVSYLAANVAKQVMTDSVAGVSNLVSNVDGSGNIIAPTQYTALKARASLTKNSAPDDVRRMIYDPDTGANMVSTLAGLFNPSPEISRQTKTGAMYNVLGFRWYEDQTVIKHTSGTFSAGGTVNGADQTGSTITVNAITGTLNKGDFITFDGVFAVNRLTRQSTGSLQQFVVTADVSNGGTSVSIYPAIVPPVGGNEVQYQTVTASPANGAAMTLLTKPSEVYIKNLGYVPQAITLGMADLWMPQGGTLQAARHSMDGVSMRYVAQYQIGTDQPIDRLDVLFGSKTVRGEWGVVMADAPAS